MLWESRRTLKWALRISSFIHPHSITKLSWTTMRTIFVNSLLSLFTPQPRDFKIQMPLNQLRKSWIILATSKLGQRWANLTLTRNPRASNLTKEKSWKKWWISTKTISYINSMSKETIWIRLWWRLCKTAKIWIWLNSRSGREQQITSKLTSIETVWGTKCSTQQVKQRISKLALSKRLTLP
jgi:hypothetical protein